MKNLIRKIDSKIIDAKLSAEHALIQAKTAMKDRSGAALWEYLLVIVIVVVIGGVLLSAIKGSNGIGKIWNNLFNQFNNLTNTNVK